MKIAVLSDFHLGFDFNGRRHEESFKNAENAFEEALNEKPDLILLLGDIFHDKIPKPEILGKALELFSKIKGKLKKVRIIRIKDQKKEEYTNIEVPAIIGIYGTHETRNKDNVNPMHILEKANLFTNLHGESIIIENESGKIGLHGLSGVPDIYVTDILKKWNPQPFPSMFNIMMMHQSFKELLPMKDPRIASFSDLPQNFDIYLLGHIHWRIEEIHPLNNAPILIPGSTIHTQLRKKESKKKKGIFILDIKKDKININFKEINEFRTVYCIEKDVKEKNPSEIISELKKEITDVIKSNAKTTEPIIKIKLIGDLSKGFTPTDINFSPLIKEFEQIAILNFDKSNLSSSKLSERTKMLFDLKTKKISVEDLGIKLLMKELKIEDQKKSEEIQNIFFLLSDGNLEKAEEEITND